MNKFSKLSVLLLAGLLATGFAACQDTEDSSSQSSSGNDSTSSSPAAEEYSAPTVTVDPAVVEIYQGGEIDLAFGVSVSDEYDSDIVATIQDDGGFDASVIGEYTITYAATNSKGETGTATRTVKVLAPLANLVLEVQKANDTKWTGGVYMNFAHDKFYTLTEDTTYDMYMNGVFYNDSEDTIVVDIPGGGAQAAIVDANGTVIEGRDGSNGKLMNKENPVRTASTVTTFEYDGQTYSVANDFARFMQIPAKGYAIVVTTGMFGDGGFDADGRSFINKNVLYQYGVAVSLYWADKEDTPLTVYADRGPTVTPPPAIELKKDSKTLDEIKAMVLTGIAVSDDNGTFNIADDVKEGLTVEIVNDGGCDSTVAGAYTFELKVVDAGGNATNFNRTVNVIDAEFADVIVGDSTYSCQAEKIAIDQDVSAAVAGAGTYSFIIYTPAYTGKVNVNGWGVAIVVDRYFKVTKVYNCVANKYYDADNTAGVAPNAGTAEDTSDDWFAAGTYAQNAFEALKEGETLIIAPNGGTNNAEGGSRYFLNSVANGTAIGKEFQLAGVTTGSVTVGANAKEVKKNTIIINETVSSYATVNFVVYTKEFTGTITANGYGEAFVMNEWGEIVRIYDGANAKYYDAENTAGVQNGTCTASGYLTEAFASLQEGEVLLCAPNGGLNSNEARAFLLSNRKIGATVSIPGLSFKYVAISLKGVETKLDRTKVVVNQTVSNYDGVDLLVYTKAFTGTVTANGYGVAIIVKDGKIVRVYDGASGKYFDADNTAGATNAGCTATGYLTEAFASLQEGEILVCGPNNSTKVGRALLYSNRTVGADVTLTNVL